MRIRKPLTALTAVLGLVVGGVLAASQASARGDTWELFPFETSTFTGYCDFPVLMTVPRNNAYQKVLTAPRGTTTLLLNGALRLTFTNEANGKTVTENVTGNGKAIINADDSLSIRQTGHIGLITLTAADAARFHLPPLAVIGGVLSEEVGPDFNYTSVTMRGHIQDNICATLS